MIVFYFVVVKKSEVLDPLPSVDVARLLVKFGIRHASVKFRRVVHLEIVNSVLILCPLVDIGDMNFLELELDNQTLKVLSAYLELLDPDIRISEQPRLKPHTCVFLSNLLNYFLVIKERQESILQDETCFPPSYRIIILPLPCLLRVLAKSPNPELRLLPSKSRCRVLKEMLLENRIIVFHSDSKKPCHFDLLSSLIEILFQHFVAFDILLAFISIEDFHEPFQKI